MSGEFPTAMLGRPSFLLGKLHAAVLDQEAYELGQLGLDVKQHAALAVLLEEGPMTQQTLGRRLGIDRTTVVAVVDGLDESEFVQRRRSPSDRRAYLLTPTRAGRQAHRRGQRAVRAAEHAALGALTEAERQTLTELLARALADADADAEPDADPTAGA